MSRTSMNANNLSPVLGLSPRFSVFESGRIPNPESLAQIARSFAFHQAHQTVKAESDNADGQDAKHDVRVNQAVVLLPDKPANTGCDPVNISPATMTSHAMPRLSR